MANIGSGYGGGGAGGGEYASDKFTTASSGADGIVYVIEVNVASIEKVGRGGLLVNHNGATHAIAGIRKNAIWQDGTKIKTHSKLKFTMHHNITSTPTRSFWTNPFKLYNNLTDGAYLELSNINGFSDDCVLADSKLISGGSFFKTLYFKSTNSPDVNKRYISNVKVHTFTKGTYYGSFGDNNSVFTYLLVLAQGAGGGGGGADNKWGLFNYAAGGGGGGGGGAVAHWVFAPINSCSYNITVGGGGTAGASGNHDQSSISSGGNGGDTSVSINFYGQKNYYTYAYGGKGGTKAGGNNNGAGGDGGSYSSGWNGSQDVSYAGSIYSVRGGSGAKIGTGGSVVAGYYETYTPTNIELFSGTFSVDRTAGVGGTTGSQDDRGGGGGASWLGNGGSY